MISPNKSHMKMKMADQSKQKTSNRLRERLNSQKMYFNDLIYLFEYSSLSERLSKKFNFIIISWKLNILSLLNYYNTIKINKKLMEAEYT